MVVRSAAWCALFALMAGPVVAQSVEERIDDIFAAWDRADSGGAVVGIVKDGALVFAKGYGMHDIASGKPLTPDSRLNLGSTSKQFATASIVLLAQEGKLSLDDDIRKHLPEMPDFGDPITIRHLIHHTSGLRDYLVLRNLAGLTDESKFGNAEVLEQMSRQRELNFRPGTDHLYCNSGYVLLAIIVERVSGMTLTEFARERIFEPLGMKQTCWDSDLSVLTEERALSYPTRGAGVAPANRQDVVEGDGNVMSTVGDLAKWDANFYDPKVGGPEFLVELLRRGRLNDGREIDYAGGLVHGTMFERPIVQHGGAWLGFRAQFTRFPKEHLSIIVLGNMATMDPDLLVERIARVYFGLPEDTPARPKPEPVFVAETVDLPKRELRAKVGAYFAEDSGTLYAVSLDDGALRVKADGAAYDLSPVGGKQFVIADGTQQLRFVFDAEGKDAPDSLTVERPNGGNTVARRVDPDTPPPPLASFTGSYYSVEADAEFVISERDGSLWVTRPGVKDATLEYVYGDVFTRGMKYRFDRDAAGRVTGFRVSLGRVKNILFERRAQ